MIRNNILWLIVQLILYWFCKVTFLHTITNTCLWAHYRTVRSVPFTWFWHHQNSFAFGVTDKKKYILLLVPKGEQEKRTEVLENKVNRMWLFVSNAFFEWTHVKSSTTEGRKQCCSSFPRNLTFSLICDKMLNITHYNKPTSLCC